MNRTGAGVAVSIVLLVLGFGVQAAQPSSDMAFFITSSGSGKGVDLGGLAGADRLASNLRLRRAPAKSSGAPI